MTTGDIVAWQHTDPAGTVTTQVGHVIRVAKDGQLWVSPMGPAAPLGPAGRPWCFTKQAGELRLICTWAEAAQAFQAMLDKRAAA